MPYVWYFQEVISISSGVKIPADIQDDLLDAQACGQAAYQAFNERLSSGQGFYNPIKLLKLKTGKKKTVKISVKNKDCLLQAEHSLFSRFLFFASLRGLHMQDVLCYPLGPIQWSIANSDGSPKQTNKSAFGIHLEALTVPLAQIPESVVIVDLMPILRKLEADHLTFDNASHVILERAMRQVRSWKTMHIVADDYHKISIKNVEREERANTGKITYNKIISGHTIREWKKILASSETKRMVIDFLASDWASNPARLQMLQDCVIYVTSGNKCRRISVEGM